MALYKCFIYLLTYLLILFNWLTLHIDGVYIDETARAGIDTSGHYRAYIARR